MLALKKLCQSVQHTGTSQEATITGTDNKDHSFPWATEIRTELRNFDIAAEFHGILQKLRNDQ